MTTELSINTVEKDNDGTFVVTLNGLPGWTFYQYEIPARPALPLIGLPAEPAKKRINVISDDKLSFSFGCERWDEAIRFAQTGSRLTADEECG